MMEVVEVEEVWNGWPARHHLVLTWSRFRSRRVFPRVYFTGHLSTYLIMVVSTGAIYTYAILSNFNPTKLMSRTVPCQILLREEKSCAAKP
jgi:hypothetical protein